MRRIAQIDILRSAKLLIDQHGEDASFIASQRADAMLAKADFYGQRTWIAIVKAISELTRTVPKDGEHTH